MKISFTTYSPEDTRSLGEIIGKRLSSGTVIALKGDLGSGKTTFVQGLAKGLGVYSEYYITSPTYTLINEYPGRIVLYHVDLFRIDGMDDAEDIGLFEILDGNGVAAIEWAEKMNNDLPPEHLSIRIDISGKHTRHFFTVAYGREMINLVMELKILLKERIWA